MILVASGTECVRLLSATTGPPAEKENAPCFFSFRLMFLNGVRVQNGAGRVSESGRFGRLI